MAMTGPKVFCIGFNKTGTTSLHKFFQGARLRSMHSANWPRFSHAGATMKLMHKHQCFSDGEQANFARLEKEFPGGLFVLNTRALRPWLRSRIKHVFRYGDPAGFEWLPPNWGWMARQYHADKVMALDSWILARALYHRQARAHFARSERFLEIDITKAPDWAELLGRFLGDRGVPMPKTRPEPPRANIRDQVSALPPGFLDAEYALVEERIAKITALYGALED